MMNTNLNNNKDKDIETTKKQTLDDSPHVLDLPSEVMIEIFLFLNIHSLKVITTVCKLWNSISMLPTLWRKMKITIKTKEDVKILEYARFKLITTIKLDIKTPIDDNFHSNRENDEVLSEILEKIPESVHEIEGQFKIHQYPNNKTRQLREVFKRLNVIQICHNPLPQQTLNLILEDMSKRDKIKSLIFFMNNE